MRINLIVALFLMLIAAAVVFIFCARVDLAHDRMTRIIQVALLGYLFFDMMKPGARRRLGHAAWLTMDVLLLSSLVLAPSPGHLRSGLVLGAAIAWTISVSPRINEFITRPSSRDAEPPSNGPEPLPSSHNGVN